MIKNYIKILEKLRAVKFLNSKSTSCFGIISRVKLRVKDDLGMLVPNSSLYKTSIYMLTKLHLSAKFKHKLNTKLTTVEVTK